MKIGDRVKVIDQDITGVIVAYSWGTKVIIEDEDSEYDAPDNRLEYRESELEVIYVRPYNEGDF